MTPQTARDVLAALAECEEYFESRADADGDSTGFVGNEEMTRLVEIRAVLARARKEMSDG